MRISDWSSDVCSSDLPSVRPCGCRAQAVAPGSASAAIPPAAITTSRLVRSIIVTLLSSSRDRARVPDIKHFSLARRSMPSRPLLPSAPAAPRSEEHTSELQSLMRISYAVFCLKKKTPNTQQPHQTQKITYIQHTHKIHT